jgi:hypothetical protein
MRAGGIPGGLRRREQHSKLNMLLCETQSKRAQSSGEARADGFLPASQRELGSGVNTQRQEMRNPQQELRSVPRAAR